MFSPVKSPTDTNANTTTSLNQSTLLANGFSFPIPLLQKESSDEQTRKERIKAVSHEFSPNEILGISKVEPWIGNVHRVTPMDGGNVYMVKTPFMLNHSDQANTLEQLRASAAKDRPLVLQAIQAVEYIKDNCGLDKGRLSLMKITHASHDGKILTLSGPHYAPLPDGSMKGELYNDRPFYIQLDMSKKDWEAQAKAKFPPK